MTPADTARVPRPITTNEQTAMGFGDLPGARWSIKVPRCRARIFGPHTAGLEIDLCLDEWAEAKNHGRDAD